MKQFLYLLLCMVAMPLNAAPWTFQQPVTVSRTQGEHIFHHLESAGRRNIALSGVVVAVVWEDNRDGVSRCYVAMKTGAANTFDKEYRISGSTEAFEPAIIGIGDGRFAIAWEEDGKAWARLVEKKGLGMPIALSNKEGMQATLAFQPDTGLYAAWVEREGEFSRVNLAKLDHQTALKLRIARKIKIEGGVLRGDQLFPSIALTRKAVMLAWEDRREGHTVILAVYSPEGKRFLPPLRLNESHTGSVQGLGRGTGAMRVVLSHIGPQQVAAVWADKRDFLAGYDVFAALSANGGEKFGTNQKVQDSFGDSIAQWHPTIAANTSGHLAVAWDDDRDGTPDIWLAWPVEGGWSDNLAVPGASGQGVQAEPVMAMDEEGNLHLAWVARVEMNGPSRIQYVMGKINRAR